MKSATDFDGFHRRTLPELLDEGWNEAAARGAAGLPPLAISLNDGRAYTYRPAASSVEVVNGATDAATVVELDEACWQGLCDSMETPTGLVLSQRARLISADDAHAYVSISDIVFGDYTLSSEGEPGGLVAVDVKNGQTAWRVDPADPVCSWGEEGCSSEQVSATTAIPGVVFSGAWDGHLRAYSTTDGAVIWDVDTATPVTAANGIDAIGGHVSGWPIQVVEGAVYVTSGSNTVVRPGNALLVYTVDGR